MCARLPQTEDEFLEVNGVGQTKLLRYGEAFLAEIAAFENREAASPLGIHRTRKVKGL